MKKLAMLAMSMLILLLAACAGEESKAVEGKGSY